MDYKNRLGEDWEFHNTTGILNGHIGIYFIFSIPINQIYSI